MRLMKNGIFSLIILYSFHNLYAFDINDIKYQRSSIIHIMIEHPMYMFNSEVAEAFKELPISDRFNDHNLGVKVVKFATQEYSNQVEYINSFIQQTNLGARAVAKWFCWNKTDGKFSMDLIKKRGFYNANLLERELASKSIRGNSILYDSGENLINNTYLIMSDICFTGSYSNKEEEYELTNKTREFEVTITSYIYKLNWDKEDLYHIYSHYNSGIKDFTKNEKCFSFDYKCNVKSTYSMKSNKFTQAELIKLVVARCIDININKLQKSYPDFRIKAAITSTNPIQADIGLKEGVNENDLYEVLEIETNDEGINTYSRVGTIKAIKGKIWDNRYMAKEEGIKEADYGYTTFEKISGKDFFPGMLIREIEDGENK